MVPTVGSGKFITAPVISNDGKPVKGASDNGFPSDLTEEGQNNDGTLDKKVIQWMLVLHQIGWYSI